MVLVAIAGGTSPTLGKSIVQALLATGQHTVVILSRSSSDQNGPPRSKYGAPIHEVDYTSVSSLTTALQGVNALISVLKMIDPDSMITAHKNLLEACKASQTPRFIMSDWSMSTASHSKVDILSHKAALLDLCNEANNSPEYDVSCSTIQVGMFMNYFAQGTPRAKINGTEDEELTAGLDDDLMLSCIDIANDTLQIPTNASAEAVIVSTTHLLDIGVLIAASLSLPPTSMRGALGLVSQEVTFAEVREILNTRCNRKIPYQTVTAEKCQQRAGELGSKLQEGFDLGVFKERMVAQMLGFQCAGVEGGATIEPMLNRLLEGARIEFRTRSVEDLLLRAWE